MGIAALILGILAAIFAWIPVVNVIAWPLAIVAIILGIISMVKGKKIGLVGIIAGVLAIIFFFVSYAVLGSMAEDALNDPAFQQQMGEALMQEAMQDPAAQDAMKQLQEAAQQAQQQ